MSITQEAVSAAIESIVDPYLGRDLVSAGAVKEIEVEGDSVRVAIELGFPVARYAAELEESLRAPIQALGDNIAVEFDIRANIVAHAVQQGAKRLSEVRNVIAVASGKGGVGKSTTSTNVALALRDEGANVAILDADIYGPSQPRMLGAQGKPESRDGQSMEPIVSYGIQSMSIGNLIEEDTPMIWRGPMVTGALEQLLNDTNWTDVDYLIIDLPPGTGDIQLTLCQKMARQYDIDLLGSLPLDAQIREGMDGGRPIVALLPDSRPSQMYREIARRTAAKLAVRGKDYSAKFPNIVVQNT